MQEAAVAQRGVLARDRSSGFAALRGVDERLAFCGEVSARVGACRDPRRAVRTLCEAVVPRLADVAAAYLTPPALPGIGSPVRLRRVALVGAGSGSGVALRLCEDEIDVAPQNGSPWARAITTARPIVVGDSLLVVPLTATGHTLGVVTLLRWPPNPPFGDLDVLVANQLAAVTGLVACRADVAEDMAAEQDDIAALPTGIEVARRSRPFGRGGPAPGRAAGWADTVPLPGSRVALIMGRVEGSWLTGTRIRTAAQVLTSLDLPPDQALRHLAELTGQLPGPSPASCVICVYDPVVRRCTIANAGHAAPLIAYPATGRVLVVAPPATDRLTTLDSAFSSIEVAAPDAAVLVLTGDDPAETSDDVRIEAARAALAAPGLSLDEVGDRLLDRVDDAGVALVARFHGIPSDQVANWYFEPMPATAARVRGLIRRTLATWRLEELTDVTELLATELVSNALRYAARPIGLRLLRTDRLICEVSDDDHHLPAMRAAAEDDESGRGLLLVSQLAEQWGTNRIAGGKVVWFTQPLPPPGASPSHQE